MAVEAPVPPSRGQGTEQVVYGMAYIAHNCNGFAGEMSGLYVLQIGDWCTNNPPSRVHNML